MSRRPQQIYNCHDLEDLARQLLFAPAEKRADQVRRAEQLHDELDAASNYPIDYLKFRITGHRSAEDDQAVLVGQAVLDDLRLLIETISHSLSMALIEGEEAESADTLAAKLNVTSRTVARWRKTGLRVRWVKLPDQPQPRLMIMVDAATHFIAQHQQRVDKAATFSQMTSVQRDALFKRARRLAMARDVSLNQVASHLAKRTGRALETLRQMLIQHDRKNPDNPVFADRTTPLKPRQQEIITRAHKRGVSVERMAKRFNRTHSTIYRAIRQRRAGELRKMPLHYFPAPTYDRDDADQVILRHVRMNELASELNVNELPTGLASLYTQPTLSVAAQQRLIIQFNYLKYKVVQLREALDRYEPRVSEMNQIDALLTEIHLRKSKLARANLSAVLSTAQRHHVDSPQTGPAAFAELLELGNPVLFDAIEQFDPGKAENFSSFVTYRLQRRFALVELDNPKAHRKLDASQLIAKLLQQAQAVGVSLVD